MNFNLDESASEILIQLKEEIREKTKTKASFSDVIREMNKCRAVVLGV